MRVILDDGGLHERDHPGQRRRRRRRIADHGRVASAPIDGFGIGVSLATSIDAPAFDCAYKLQEYSGQPKRKLSEGKQTWPGRKQVWRSFDAEGRMRGDILSIDGDKQPGEPLIVPVMRGGKRIGSAPTLDQIRERSVHDLARLPLPLRAVAAGRELSGRGFRRAQEPGGPGGYAKSQG